MQAFTDFILQVTYPPNPVRAFTNTLNAAQQAGHDLYVGAITDTVRNCNGCHTLDVASGFFGTQADVVRERDAGLQDPASPQRVPEGRHVRHAGDPAPPVGPTTHQGDQVRGFGFLHDGSIDTLFRFHGSGVFSLNDTEQRNLEQFMLAFDSNLAPIVGQQITLTNGNAGVAGPRIDLLIARAAANECELT